MVWGCIAANGVGNLVFIDEIMKKESYLDIIKNNLHSSAHKLGSEGRFYFQQDNDPKHTAYIVKQWLLYNTPQMLHTPPQSLDLNPIEYIWEELERQIRKRPITNRPDLKERLVQEYNGQCNKKLSYVHSKTFTSSN